LAKKEPVGEGSPGSTGEKKGEEEEEEEKKKKGDRRPLELAKGGKVTEKGPHKRIMLEHKFALHERYTRFVTPRPAPGAHISH